MSSTTDSKFDQSQLRRILNPRSIAIVGASDDPNRLGGRPIAYMLGQGYRGKIYPVNPNRETIQGLSCVPSIEALPEVPDIAMVIVPASLTLAAVRSLAILGTPVAIVCSSGFAEMDENGARAQKELVEVASSHGMRLIGPNALGLINPRKHFYATFLSAVELGYPKPGSVAIISQSGAYGGHLLVVATQNNIGISSVVMTGNESDLTVGDMLLVAAQDPLTRVIMVYSEGIKRAESLIAGLKAARKARKPVIMMKVGTSVVGSSAAQSHTASIAGDDRVVDAVLSEFGVVRVQSTEQMMDVTRLAVRGIFPVNNTLGVMTLSGGAGVIISDAAEAVGLAMPEMPIDSQKKLLALLPYAAPRNPVDVTAQYVNDMSLISKFTDTLVSDGNYRSILGFFTYAGGAPSVASRLREQMNIVRAKHTDCLFVLSLLGSSEQIDEYEKDGFSVFEDPNRAVYAIEAMGRFGRAFEKRKFLKPPIIEPFVLPQKTPNEIESKQLLYAAAGIVSVPEVLCNDPEKAVQAARSLGYPVVLKIVSPDILHKSDIGGVIIGVDNDVEVRRAYALILKRVHQALGPELVVDGVLVAKQVSSGVECIMGIQQDPVFGPIAVVGLGGIFVDIFQDVSLRRCPFGVDVAKEMICSLKGVSLLQGARGRPPADITAAARALARLSVFAAQAGPRLRSIDINPILVRPNGQGALALDAVIELDEE